MGVVVPKSLDGNPSPTGDRRALNSRSPLGGAPPTFKGVFRS